MDEGDRIVVGFDGSRDGLAAARWALDEAFRRGCDVELVTCWEVPHVLGHLGGYCLAPEDVIGKSRRVQETAFASLAQEVQRNRAACCAVEDRVLPGPPGPMLAIESKSAVMLVIGRIGLQSPASRMLGSVSAHLTAHAPCPVVVVGAPDADADGLRAAAH